MHIYIYTSPFWMSYIALLLAMGFNSPLPRCRHRCVPCGHPVGQGRPGRVGEIRMCPECPRGDGGVLNGPPNFYSPGKRWLDHVRPIFAF